MFEINETEALKALKEYNIANKGDPARYGRLMLDRSTGEVWCDVFYDLGHNDVTHYKSEAIIDLAKAMSDRSRYYDFTVTKANIVDCIKKLSEEWEERENAADVINNINDWANAVNDNAQRDRNNKDRQER